MTHETCPMRTLKHSMGTTGGAPRAYCANDNLCLGEKCDYPHSIEEIKKLRSAVVSLGNRIVELEQRLDGN